MLKDRPRLPECCHCPCDRRQRIGIVCELSLNELLDRWVLKGNDVCFSVAAGPHRVPVGDDEITLDLLECHVECASKIRICTGACDSRHGVSKVIKLGGAAEGREHCQDLSRKWANFVQVRVLPELRGIVEFLFDEGNEVLVASRLAVGVLADRFYDSWVEVPVSHDATVCLGFDEPLDPCLWKIREIEVIENHLCPVGKGVILEREHILDGLYRQKSAHFQPLAPVVTDFSPFVIFHIVAMHMKS